MIASCPLRTDDGLALEAELAVPDGPVRAAAVLCHPHPQHGGSMRSFLVGELFRALPAAAVTVVRFNFRGVEGSEGTWGGGLGEQHDVRAALDELVRRVDPTVPVVLAGWSFGADLALGTVDDRVAAWLAIAPPLRYAGDIHALGADPRSKTIVLGGRDNVVSVDAVQRATSDWVATTIDVVPGASHFFVGRSDAVISVALRVVDAVAAG